MYPAMLDRPVRKFIDPWLEVPAASLAAWNVPANAVTIVGFALGIGGCVAIALHRPSVGLMLILANRLADGLDGCVARRRGASDAGGFLDIVLDVLFYGGVPFSFAWAEPELLLPACFLIYSFLGTTGAFLAYAVISAKQGVTADDEGKKSFFYSAGLMEGTETIFFFVLFCLFPGSFAPLAWTFGILCWITILIRVVAGAARFRTSPVPGAACPADECLGVETSSPPPLRAGASMSAGNHSRLSKATESSQSSQSK
jgi:phosphatidylglycerophosphate synthase